MFIFVRRRPNYISITIKIINEVAIIAELILFISNEFIVMCTKNYMVQL